MSRLGIGNAQSIKSFVAGKTARLAASDHSFRAIFEIMNSEGENIFLEETDGYRVRSITYARFRARSISAAVSLNALCAPVEKNAMVGIYMNNSERWLEVFWGLLMAGYRPLLMNTRLSAEQLEHTLSFYHVPCVISDGQAFSVTTINASDISVEENPCDDLGSFSWTDEIFLMTSGTSNRVKLCAYTGENMTCQILNSGEIIRQSSEVQQHYHNRMKLLTFLPFYHVFGLVAVFMWFGFFSRTFVLLKDYAPDTIVNTVKKLEVTHIFSVPMLWNTVYAKATRTIRSMDQATQEKLDKGFALYERLSICPPVAKAFSKVAFRQVREKIFGESIRFLISGGSAIPLEVLRFFNAIGYHLANGYGMTETGITSVELSNRYMELTDGSVGKPFKSVSYRVNDKGILEVKGNTLASRVLLDGCEIEKDGDGWFSTGDCAKLQGQRCFILGREDDVIIGQDGENINPDMMETEFHIPGVKALCLVRDGGNEYGALILQVPVLFDAAMLQEVRGTALSELGRLRLNNTIKRIVLTPDALMGSDEFKVNRRKLAERLSAGTLREANAETAREGLSALGMNIALCFASALEKDADSIGGDMDFFTELGGSSLEYFAAISMLRNQYGIDFPLENGKTLSTVNQLAEYIRKNGTEL